MSQSPHVSLLPMIHERHKLFHVKHYVLFSNILISFNIIEVVDWSGGGWYRKADAKAETT